MGNPPSSLHIQQLVGMGFDAKQAERALRKCGFVEQAIELLSSGAMDSIPRPQRQQSTVNKGTAQAKVLRVLNEAFGGQERALETKQPIAKKLCYEDEPEQGPGYEENNEELNEDKLVASRNLGEWKQKEKEKAEKKK